MKVPYRSHSSVFLQYSEDKRPFKLLYKFCEIVKLKMIMYRFKLRNYLNQRLEYMVYISLDAQHSQTKVHT